MILRNLAWIAVWATTAQIAQANGAEGNARTSVELWADRDDDDADGVADGDESELRSSARADLQPVDPHWTLCRWTAVAGGEHTRIVTDVGPLAWGQVVPRHAWLQGITPGSTEIRVDKGAQAVRLRIDVGGVEWRSSAGDRIDPTRSHLSLERMPPFRADARTAPSEDDPDAAHVVVSLPGGAADPEATHSASLESVGAFGARLGLLAVELSPILCPSPNVGMSCWRTAPIRLVVDTVDRDSPLASERSVLAQVGGALVLRWNGRKAQMIRVLGPRTTPAGSIERLRAQLRPFVVRLTRDGLPAIGGTGAGAVEAMRTELASAAAIWGQCGVTFGDERTWKISVVDPPPSHLVSLGDDLGIPASGGVISFRVGDRHISMSTFPGESVEHVTRQLVRNVELAGLKAIAFPNARIGPGVESSMDVSVRTQDGVPVAATVVSGIALSTDATLVVRIGSVDLANGLDHFSDSNAVAGSLEERTLVKAFDDGDPTTIEVFVVPLFSGSGRIGESFIGSDFSSLRNVVLVDRAGVSVNGSSFTLPHELGHVLMDLPGHPDDYALDTPTSLMDSDASDASAFGPRRLSVEDCARVLRQSGPGARVPLLAAWPVGPLAL